MVKNIALAFLLSVAAPCYCIPDNTSTIAAIATKSFYAIIGYAKNNSKDAVEGEASKIAKKQIAKLGKALAGPKCTIL